MKTPFRLDEDKEVDAVTDLLYRRCTEFRETADREDGREAVRAAQLMLSAIYAFLNKTKE